MNLIATGMTATQQSYYFRLKYDLGRYTTSDSLVVSSSAKSSGGFSMAVPQTAGTTSTLWRCTDLAAGFWAPVGNATSNSSGGNTTLTDPTPPSDSAFYSVVKE